MVEASWVEACADVAVAVAPPATNVGVAAMDQKLYLGQKGFV